ncbi:DEAD/DEAH box helicase [Robertmurraya korlensis]|uniref:DEAD/DEAH box helicase n=1 Tax=Robertmurraya korlensis TaxID=519977 RepID=UPI00203B4401|nr:DEAD/DEAH box helicase [Robertmurraya korlensis]MCM3602661.1 DEAD/DEAH box helicase [Robertmurraya korlensis]
MNLVNPLRNVLAGKQLLREEIPFELVDSPSISQRPGIVVEKKGRAYCNRCGNSDMELLAEFPCARCGKKCLYCRTCIMMGRVSECTPLYGWSGEMPEIDAAPLQWKGTLSDGQQVASDRVVEAISHNEELLVWAVCGAGKTELLFKGIEMAFANCKRVCIATPRTDVVLELTPRLQSVFPSIEVASLYGGSDDRHQFSPLTITTTHQLLRFYEAFDVMIVDEVDAFPYSVDPMLKFAVKNARKESSSLIYLTATPIQKWQRECRGGKRKFVTIPARFHRRALPEPEFVWCGNWGKVVKKGQLPVRLQRWVEQRLLAGTPMLVFVPTVEWMLKLLPLLQMFDNKIESVHAEDPERKEKVLRMRKREIPLLITTTILERGVTFPGLEVAVLGAEDPIFTEAALVQIAGRVGRSVIKPSGNVTYFHNGKTESMVKAKHQIVSMNKEAKVKGLIDE